MRFFDAIWEKVEKRTSMPMVGMRVMISINRQKSKNMVVIIMVAVESSSCETSFFVEQYHQRGC